MSVSSLPLSRTSPTSLHPAPGSPPEAVSTQTVPAEDSFQPQAERQAASSSGDDGLRSAMEFRSQRRASRAAQEAPAFPAMGHAEAQAVAEQRAREITQIADPAVRNFRITQAYSDISARLAETLGTTEANWCTYATWASRQAGQTIRRQDVPGLTPLAFLFNPLVGLAAHLGTESASAAVARGNLKVYAELAPQFLGFIRAVDGQTQPDPARFEAFLQGLKPGRTEDGGQDLLREAFICYYQAKFEADPDRKSELLFHANLCVGLHEQMRLQPEIAEAIPQGARWVMTELMMKLRMPHETLSLGDDVPVRGRMFPPQLERIEDPRLREILARFDRTPDTTVGSAADDWTSFDDRMNYIADLFRSRQQDFSLFDQPLAAAERARVRAAGHDAVGLH